MVVPLMAGSYQNGRHPLAAPKAWHAPQAASRIATGNRRPPAPLKVLPRDLSGVRQRGRRVRM